MSVKFELPLDELTIHVWLLYDHQNFKDFNRDIVTDGQRDTVDDFPSVRLSFLKYRVLPL